VPRAAAEQARAAQGGAWGDARLSGAELYAQKVLSVAQHLHHVFSPANLVKDAYLARHMLPDGTVPFNVVLSFPRVRMLACTVRDPCALLAHAAQRVPLLHLCARGVGNREWRDEYRAQCAELVMQGW
jgi:hypothetical protein